MTRTRAKDEPDVATAEPVRAEREHARRLTIAAGGSRTDPAASGDPLAVGVRLREARLRKGMSLAEVGAAAGLSRSFLSKAERGLCSASLTSLIAWTEALEVNFGSLFESLPVSAGGRTPALAYRGRGVLEFLLTPFAEKRFEVFEQQLDPGETPDLKEWSVDADFAFVYVASGRLNFVEGDTTIALGKGDLHVYSPRAPHRWVNPSAERTTILVCDSPAAF